MLEARLVTIRPGEDPEPYVFGDKRPFALRADRNEIAPGESGNVAVVVDRSAFKTENGNAELILEIYRKDGSGWQPWAREVPGRSPEDDADSSDARQ